jgi:hypothetical protein
MDLQDRGILFPLIEPGGLEDPALDRVALRREPDLLGFGDIAFG